MKSLGFCPSVWIHFALLFHSIIYQCSCQLSSSFSLKTYLPYTTKSVKKHLLERLTPKICCEIENLPKYTRDWFRRLMISDLISLLQASSICLRLTRRCGSSARPKNKSPAVFAIGLFPGRSSTDAGIFISNTELFM